MSREARSVLKQEGGYGFSGSLFRRAIAFLFATLLFTFSSPALAKNDKVADDLKEKVEKESPVNRVRVVLNLRGVDPVVIATRVMELDGEVHKHLKNLDEMIVDLPLGAIPSLAEVEGLDYIAPDRPVQGAASHIETATGTSLATSSSPYSFLNLVAGLDGTGVTVAVIDSGMDADHLDLKDEARGRRRVILSFDFTGRGGLDDPYGHGTHVAGLIAGDGSASYLVGRDYTGIAPGANLINFKVLDERGRGFISNVVAAIDQVITLRNYYNVRVINLSLAAPPVDSYANDPMCRAVERATKAGIIVVTAAGNFGLDQNGNKLYGSIASPGISPSAITVGATSTRGTDIRSDDTVAPYSSRGPTLSRTTDALTGQVTYDNLAKPDLVAPGTRIVSAERYGDYLVTTYPGLHVDTGLAAGSRSRYMTLTGTSMSTAIVSGAVAVMLQANPSLTPNQVKAILMYSAQIMDGPDLFEQGAGMVNVDGAVRLAKSLSKYSSIMPAGTTLAANGLPTPQSTIAGETCLWSQALIWGFGMLRGEAVLATQQAAYAQSLIWGFRADAWGQGVSYYDGLYSDSYVVFGANNQWSYVTWNSTGTPLPSGLIWNDRLSGSGLIWSNRVISNDFFSLTTSALIWGYGGNDAGLIWSLQDSGLIWGGLNNVW